MTDNKPVITAYALHWHIHTSGAFHDLLVKPLAPYADIRFVGWEYYEDLPLPEADTVTIFCQYPPPESWLKQAKSPMVWIPMADHDLYPPSIAHHPHVRVVAFSHEVATWAENLGLPYLRLQYFMNPEDFPQATFDDGLVMLYWNRLAFYRPRFLRRMCKVLGMKRVIFRARPDESLAKYYNYRLPRQMNGTVVEMHDELTSRDDFLAMMRRSNVFLTPRRKEGVGFVMLEALASGCAVFGYDAPTMNEYIESGVNGFLFPEPQPETRLNKMFIGLFRKIFSGLFYLKHGKFPLHLDALTFRDWEALRQLDLAQLGANARRTQAEGYRQWVAQIPEYAEFVLKNHKEKSQ